MSKYFLYLFLSAIILPWSADSQDQPFHLNREGEILLPSQGYSVEFELLQRKAQQRHNTSERWKEFRSEHGDWYALWNDMLPSPNRLWGEGYQLPGFHSVTKLNHEAAARTALDYFSEILAVETEDLTMVGSRNYKGKWAVHFEQRYKGLPVLLSHTTVRITDGGRVFLLGSEYYPEMNISTTPKLSEGAAKVAAFTGLKLNAELSTEQDIVNEGMYVDMVGLAVLPYKTTKGIEYKLVYDMVLHLEEMRILRTVVDANDGTVLWRYNRVSTGINGKATASVKTQNVRQAATTEPVRDMYVNIGGTNVTTDSAGNYTSTKFGTLIARLRGPYARTINEAGSDAQITLTASNNRTYNLDWTNSNSTLAERNAFFNTNRTLSWIKSFDPQFDVLDYQMEITVNKTQNTCNAFWNGSGMGFYRAGSNCANTAEMVEVVAHEYGHGINQKLYEDMGQSFGMLNGSMNEGLADANACLLMDTPDMGVGFFNNNNPLRDLDNTNRYPDDVSQSIHTTGLIIGGAIWDMRQAIGLSTATELVHFAKYGTPNDVNTGIVFTQYFIEVLAVDDNDGNLSNGTPNSTDIVQAFLIHGIPAMSLLSIDHDAIANALANADIPVDVTVTPNSDYIQPTSVKIHYRTRGQGNYSTVTLQHIGGQLWQPSQWFQNMPGQSQGTLIEYYLEASEPISGSVYFPIEGANNPFVFPVGYTTDFLHDFESNHNWAAGDPSDNATTGEWELGNPIGTTVNGAPVQPADDHTANGQLCYFTGNAPANSAAGTNDVDDGKTTLTTPTFSLTGLQAPIIRYWRWFSNDLGASPLDDDWVVQISSNNGSSWVSVEDSNEPFNYWSPNVIVVSDYVQPSGFMRMRFIASDFDPGSLVEAAVDDFEVLYVDPVPVELAALSANRIDRSIAVSWTTETETNNYGFDVEYKLEQDEHWQKAGFVEGKGTTSATQNYAYRFAEASGQALQVRLKQMDFDGTQNYSPTVNVAAGALSFALHQNYPNPFAPSTRVRFELPEQLPVRIEIVSILGKTVQSYDLGSLDAGIHDVQLDMNGLNPGNYIYRLNAGDRVLTRIMNLAR
ncbi:MAG: hypothetical protein CL946_04130 [Ectothiorhodospiraceae bacterium]|nr:hypothetical protein [Ectothiorhodospiraceae bacterium]